jgi:hypothetical protein
MLLIRDSTLKSAFLCSSCWALAPVLNEFIVSTAFGDVDYSSNVGQCHEICEMHSTRQDGLALRRFRVVVRFPRHAGLVRDDYIITANTALVEKAWAHSRRRVFCTAARLGIGDALEDEVRRILTCVSDLTDSQAMAR